MTKKEKLYQAWLSDPRLNVNQFAPTIDLDRSTAYKYLKEFKDEEPLRQELIDLKKTADQISKADEDFLAILKKEGSVPIMKMCDRIGMIPKEVLEAVRYYRSKGIEVGIIDDRVIYSKEPLKEDPLKNPLGDREIGLGIASDPHFGSKACQITALNQFCEACRKEGIKDIIVPGDITAGTTVYRGQHEDIYAFNPADQEDSCITNLPSGFRWWMIGGNHDYDAMKSNGHNVIKSLAHKREDINYLGYDQATLPLLENVDAILWHPSGGVPYALSYRMQKGIEEQAYSELMRLVEGQKEKPTLRFFFTGHLHVQLQAMFGPIFGAQCGTFEGRTNYLKRKGFSPNIGGYILKACLDSNGRLKEHEARFKHYQEIENDYLNYQHTPKDEAPVTMPILAKG